MVLSKQITYCGPRSDYLLWYTVRLPTMVHGQITYYGPRSDYLLWSTVRLTTMVHGQITDYGPQSDYLLWSTIRLPTMVHGQTLRIITCQLHIERTHPISSVSWLSWDLGSVTNTHLHIRMTRIIEISLYKFTTGIFMSFPNLGSSQILHFRIDLKLAYDG